MLKFEEGATLELDKYDTSAQPPSPVTPASDPAPPTTTPPTDDGPAPSESVVEPATQHKKRFTLRIRKRTHPHAAEDANRVSVAGPALQVVDAETHGQNGNGSAVASGAGKEAPEKDEGGVRVVIKLEALDANGELLLVTSYPITKTPTNPHAKNTRSPRPTLKLHTFTSFASAPPQQP